MSSLLGLHNDALRAVLVRTCASDHLNLCLTCSRVNGIINSQEFRQERCESETAEVSVKILSPFELYQAQMGSEEISENDDWFQEQYDDFGARDPDYGYQENQARIHVDGKLAGKTSFTLLPRNNHRVNFHDMADSISQDVQETGCAFFDSRGRPRLKCVKEVLERNDQGAFLYIKSLDLTEPEYRTTTSIGAKALRMLLKDTSLNDKWSVAAYIPDARSQFNQEDRRRERGESVRQRRHFMARMMEDEEDASDTESEKDWQERRNDLSKLDMRQFLRVGFLQAKELLMDHKCFFLFAVPTFLRQPLMTHEEAMSTVIAEKQRREQSRDEKKLLKEMARFCTEKRQIDDARRELHRPREEQRMYQHMQENTEQTRAHLRAAMDECRGILRQVEGTIQTVAALLSATSAAEVRPGMSRLSSQALDGLSDEAVLERLESMKPELGQILDASTEALARGRNLADTQFATITQQLEETERTSDVEFQHTVDSGLESLRQKTRELNARVRSKVSELVEKAGTDIIVNSDSIHACACHLQPEFIELLLDFVPDAKKLQAINNLDTQKETPLRIAAQSGMYSSQCPEIRLETCQKIIELGGDKNLVDANGLTALGKFRRADRGMRDFYGAHGTLNLASNPTYRAQVESASAMEELLRPVLGPTTADDAILEDGSESDVEEEDDDENGDSDEDDDAGEANEEGDENNGAG